MSNSSDSDNLPTQPQPSSSSSSSASSRPPPPYTQPIRGILKSSSSFDNKSKTQQDNSCQKNFPNPSSSSQTRSCLGPENRKSAKFDEMNIIETLHPPDKDYGHMKIEEPKTPFNYFDEEEEQSPDKPAKAPLDADEFLKHLNDKKESNRKDLESESEEEEDDANLDPTERAKKVEFDSKRKAHYNEFHAVKLARKLMEEESDGEDEEGSNENNKNSDLDQEMQEVN